MNRSLGFVLLAFGIIAAVVGGIGTIVAIGELNRGGAGMLIPFLLVDVVGVTLIVLAVVVLSRAPKTTYATSAGSAGTAHYPPNQGVVHELDKTPYTTVYTPPVKGKHSRPSVLTISARVECKCEFQMAVETWFDKMCKRLGIASEVQTGDEKFDDECYVRSDTPEFAAAYLGDPLKRIAILDLRRFGFRELTLADGKLSTKWVGFNPDSDHRDELGEEVAARLLVLSRNLPAHQPEFDHRTGTHRKTWQAILWVFLVLFAATNFALIAFPPVETGDLLIRMLVLLLTWPLFAYVSAYLLSGTSRSHNAWGGLVLGSLFLFPVGCAGTVALFNGALDASPDVTHDALIVDKYTTRSKNKTNYHVRCQSWQAGGGTISFSVGSSDYGRVTPGRSKMVVVTKSGWLGMEWVRSKRVDANPGP